MAASLICGASAFLGIWSTSAAGEDQATLQSTAAAANARVVMPPIRFRPMMRNVNEGKGLFAPVVVVARNVIGKKRFNQQRQSHCSTLAGNNGVLQINRSRRKTTARIN